MWLLPSAHWESREQGLRKSPLLRVLSAMWNKIGKVKKEGQN
jgi:hypothetical protein